MLIAPSPAIDSCGFLFLRWITELDYQQLRLVIEEGRSSAESTTLDIGGTKITDAYRVKATGRHFEITWEDYIAYCVRNESYCSADKYEEIAVGKKLCIYSKSHFLDYISRTTSASSEYPGPFQHYCIICEDHVIDVVSIHSPQIQELPPRKSEANKDLFRVN